MTEIPPRAIEEARRRRNYQIANDLYVDLQRRSAEAQLAAASSIPDLSILDRATVSRNPSGDRSIQLAGMAFMAFSRPGIPDRGTLHKFDPKLRDPGQIGGQIGLDWLGTIPRYRKGSGGSDNSDEIREAFRDLRLKIDFAFGAARPLILSITSPSPGEGKTFVAANLANSFADLGRKTILVDGDTRRGDLHHILNLNRKPGLTDFLMNGGSHSIIQTTDNTNLHFVGFGSRSTSSPELLNSSAMQTFLAGLKRRYEVILFDCPPMAAGSDAFVLGAHTGDRPYDTAVRLHQQGTRGCEDGGLPASSGAHAGCGSERLHAPDRAGVLQVLFQLPPRLRSVGGKGRRSEGGGGLGRKGTGSLVRLGGVEEKAVRALLGFPKGRGGRAEEVRQVQWFTGRPSEGKDPGPDLRFSHGQIESI